MMLAAVIAAAIAFYEAFVAAKTPASVAALQAHVARSIGIFRSTTLSDEDKASGLQSLSGATFKAVAAIVAKIGAAGVAALAVLYAASFAAGPFETLAAYAVRPTPLIVSAAVLLLYAWIRHGRKR